MAAGDDLKVLAQVIRVARDELADRERDEIPNRLRPAAKGTGKRLPTPHQRAIIDYLTSDEPFRSAVKDRWDESGFDDEVGGQFLEDPDQAATAISLSVASIDLDRVVAERDGALVTANDLAAQLAESKARLDKERGEQKAALGRLAASDKRSREGLERAAEVVRERLRDAELQIAALTAGLEQAEAANEALSLTLDRLAERATKREPASLPRRFASRAQMASRLPSDPAELGSFLDAMEKQMRPYREPELRSKVSVGDLEELSIPGGISPDSAEAVAAAIEQGPDRFLIDGYNVAGAVRSNEFSTRAGRDAAVARADMLKRATSAGVTIVFDASGVKGEDRFMSNHGVEVVFEPERSADDAIVSLVAAQGDRCVVITDDRELQSRATRPNCLVLYTKALVAWSEHLNDS